MKHNQFSLLLKYLATALFAVILLLPQMAAAATIYVYATDTSIAVGDIVTARVVISTPDVAINSAEGAVNFPADLLEVVSVSKSGTFSMWIEEPSFSNSAGRITFNGGVANPGYMGKAGGVISIVFKAKKAGSAVLFFSGTAVRANDGLGTNVLTSRGGATIEIAGPATKQEPVKQEPVKQESVKKEPEKKPVETKPVVKPVKPEPEKKPEVKVPVPAKPDVVSVTNPVQTMWYANNTASVSWAVPSGVTGVLTLLDSNPVTEPTALMGQDIREKTFNNLADGIYYFHVQYSNASGKSIINHYQLNIDTTAPSAFVPTIEKVNEQSRLMLAATDAGSGIDRYTIQIDGAEPVTVVPETPTSSISYLLPEQSFGDHRVTVVAYDKVGNHTESTLTIPGTTITAPILSLSATEIKKGDSITIFGKTDYPNTQVILTLEIPGVETKKYTQLVTDQGLFSVTFNNIEAVGTINVWAESVLPNAMLSPASAKLMLQVVDKPNIVLALTFPQVVTILVLLLLIQIVTWLGWYKYFSNRKK